MSRQFRLRLQQPPSHRREDFVVSESNTRAVEAVDSWPRWYGGALALVGPAGSGKTHLARAWLDQVQGVELAAFASTELGELQGRPVLLENADRAPDELLFHLINMAPQAGGGLLLTARTAPAQWTTSLPDLRSRLNALAVAELGPPDDVILTGVLQKFFRERNIRPADDVLPYLVRRMERSVPVAEAIVERLDEASAAEHRAVSRALARQILDDDPRFAELFATPLAELGGEEDNDR